MFVYVECVRVHVLPAHAVQRELRPDRVRARARPAERDVEHRRASARAVARASKRRGDGALGGAVELCVYARPRPGLAQTYLSEVSHMWEARRLEKDFRRHITSRPCNISARITVKIKLFSFKTPPIIIQQ